MLCHISMNPVTTWCWPRRRSCWRPRSGSCCRFGRRGPCNCCSSHRCWRCWPCLSGWSGSGCGRCCCSGWSAGGAACSRCEAGGAARCWCCGSIINKNALIYRKGKKTILFYRLSTHGLSITSKTWSLGIPNKSLAFLTLQLFLWQLLKGQLVSVYPHQLASLLLTSQASYDMYFN